MLGRKFYFFHPRIGCLERRFITKVLKLVDFYSVNHARSNISNMRCSVSSPDETPRRELKIRRAAEYF